MSPRPTPLRPRAGLPAQTPQPEHKRFDKLTQQVEHARRTLSAWHSSLPDFLSTHREQTRQRIHAVQAIHLAWLHALDQLLSEKGWTQRERDVLQDLLCETAWQMLERQAQPDPSVEALYDRHATRPYAEVHAADLRAAAKLAGPSAHHEAEATMDGNGDTDAAPPSASSPPSSQPSPSLREIYRKLASALHPDREPDPDKRAHRTEMMKRVNLAHDQKDLLALLALQIETAQISPEDITQAPPSQLAAYNQALTEQLAHVKAQIKDIEADFRSDFMVPRSVNLHPHQLDKVLALHLGQLHHTQAALEADLATFADRAATKRWIKAWAARGA
jgi:hypothetical protein